MKRILSVLLVFIFLLSLAGCKSEDAKKVDNLILSIGEVTLESESIISRAEQAVEALPDKDYEDLENIQILEDAREKYDALVEIKKAEEFQKTKEKAYKLIDEIDQKMETQKKQLEEWGMLP